MTDDTKQPESRLDELRARRDILERLRESALKLTAERDLRRLLDLIVRLAIECVNGERSTMYLVEPEDAEERGVEPCLVSRVTADDVDIRVPINQHSLAGSVAATGETLNVPDAYEDPRFDSSFDRKHGFRTRAILAEPIRDRGGKVIGVVQVINRRGGGAFTGEDEPVLGALAAQAGIAIENTRYLRAQRRTFEGLLHGQALAVDARDPLTSGHTTRVTRYAEALAEEMGLPGEERDLIRYAGLVHDQGKIGVPDYVLQKPGKLTDEEFRIIQSHAQKTKLLLNAVRGQFPRRFRALADIASHHHEKPNGTGYPDGLKGDELSLGARIIAAADVFDALTSTRHYRSPAPDDKVVAMLREYAEAGKMDGEVVEALASALPRLAAIRTEVNDEIQKSESSGGLSGIAHLRVLPAEWEEAESPDSGVGKAPEDAKPNGKS